MQEKLQKFVKLSGYLFGCLFLSLTFLSNNISATSGHTLSITNSGDINLSADPGNSATTTDTLELISTCPNGYRLSIEGASDTSLYRDGNSNNRGEEDSQVIKSAAGTFAEPAELTENTWGYKLNPNSTFYSGITSDPVEILSSNEGTGEDPNESLSFSIHYGAKLSDGLLGGDYKTDVNDEKSTVVYTLVSEPTCESATFENGRYLNNLMVTGTEPATRVARILPTNKTNSDITSFEEATDEEFASAEADDDVEIYEVQTEDSAYPIYLWFDTDTREVEGEITDPDTGETTTGLVEEKYNIGVNWYSEAKTVYFNQDSSYFFNYMLKMNSIDLSRIDGSKSLDLSYMFRAVARDASEFIFEFPEGFTVNSATNLSGMFISACQGTNQTITSHGTCSITIDDEFNAENALSTDSMFQYFGEYFENVSINLGNNFNISSSTTAASMFNSTASRSHRTDIDLGDNFNISSATNLTSMFSNACVEYDSSRKDATCNINLGKNFNAESALNLSYMFYNAAASNTKYFNLDLGDNFNAKSATNMNYLFYMAGKNATDMSIDLGKNFHKAIEGVSLEMQYMFSNVGYNASSTFDLNFGDEFDTSNVTNTAYMFSDFAHIVPNYELVLPDSMVMSNVINAARMFQGVCYSTTTTCSITINDAFNLEKATDTSYMFWRTGVNTSSFSLDLGANFNSKSSKNMSYMFAEMGQKGNMTLDFGENFRTDEALNMSYMFSGTAFRDPEFTLTLPSNFSPKKATNMAYMFNQLCHDSTVSCSLDINDEFNSEAVQNMSNMFREVAYNVPSFTIDLGSGFKTSTATDMSGMFFYFAHATPTLSLDLGENFITTNVTNMSYMFSEMGYSATSLTFLNFSDNNGFNTAHVTNMSNMFDKMAYSVGTLNLHLPTNFSTISVTTMTHMFQETGYKATSSSIDFNDSFQTDNVKDMSYMFYGFGASATDFELILPARINAHSATTLYAMFDGTCQGVTKTANSCLIKLDDNFNAQAATNTGYMFRGVGRYVKTVEIDLGNNFNAKVSTNVSSFFVNACADVLVENCTVKLGDNFNISAAKDFSTMFYYYWGGPSFANSAQNVYLDLGQNFNAISATSMNNIFAGVAANSTGSVTMKLGENFHPAVEGVSVTMAGMFENAIQKSNDIDLDFGDMFDSSNATSMEGMFRGFAYLVPTITLALPDEFVATSVTTTKEMFYRTCGRATTSCTITINDTFNASQVTNVEKMFAEIGTDPIGEVTINLGQNFNGGSITNYKYMFSKAGYGASEFSINLGPNFDTSSGQNMSYMFEYMGHTADEFMLNLGSLFDTSAVTDMSYMFREMGYTATTFAFNGFNDPQFNTENVQNMSYMFSHMAHSVPVLNLIMPENFDTSNVTNMSYMFNGPGYLATVSSIDFGDHFDTSNVINMSYMFDSFGYSATEFDFELPDSFVASSATTLRGMFEYLCNGVANVSTSCDIKINDTFNASSATDINNLFYSAGTNAYEVSIDMGANFNVKSAASVENLLVSACSGVNVSSCHVNFGDNFNAESSSIGYYLFNRYYYTAFAANVKDELIVDFGKNFNIKKATNMSSMMNGFGNSVTGTVKVYLGENFHPAVEGVLVNGDYMFQSFAPNASTVVLDFGDNFDTSNFSSMVNMFSSAMMRIPVINLTLPNKFSASSATSLSNMFGSFGYYSQELRLTLPDSFNPKNVTEFSNMFQNMGHEASICELDLGSNFDTSSALKMASMFDGVANKATTAVLDLGEKFDTSKVQWMYNIFIFFGQNASDLYIDLGPLFSNASVTQYSNMFTEVGSRSIRNNPDHFMIYAPNEEMRQWILTNNSSYLNSNGVTVGSL